MARGMLWLALALAAVPDPLVYHNLPSTTARPFPIDRSQFAMCAPAPLVPNSGPHDTPALKMYLNDVASAGLRDRRRPMKTGAVIVKEKWATEDARHAVAYAAMIKREPGYDANHGDWEYVYAELDGERRIERGRIASCFACHKAAAKGDYLFGRHLQIKQKSPNVNRKPTHSNY